MKLQLFNGGLNIRQAPELILPNEAIVCNNVSLSSGQLKSAQGLSDILISAIPKAFYFLTETTWMPNGDTRDYLEYQGKLYWTDGATAKKYSGGVTQNLGIIKPSDLTTVVNTVVKPVLITGVLNGVGLLTGSYTYVYTYFDSVNNIESLPSPLSSLNATLNKIDITVTASTDLAVTNIKIYRKGETLTEYSEVITLANTTVVYTDNVIDSGIPGTEILELLNGTIQYTYTYYNIDDGTESQPSPLSSELDVENSTVLVDVIASTDPQVTNIIIYRIGDSFLAFTKVVELPNNTATYLDKIIPSNLATIILDSNENGEAPAGLKYLTELGGVFLGVVGTKLYFSRDIGNPNYWPQVNYLDFRADLTGIGIAAAGIIVFTKYRAWIVTGTNIATFISYPLSGDQGCISHKTIAELGGAILFMSTDGICTATGASVIVTTKFKLGKQNYDPIVAIVYDEEYLCQLADGSIIALDLRYEPAIETYNFNTTWLAIADDVLYGEITTGFYEMFAGDQVTYDYNTGNLTEGAASELKSYDDIYFSVIGTHTVKVYIDDILIATKVIIGVAKPQKMKVPEEFQRGSYIRFEFTGIGTVKEIDYEVTRRING